MMLKAILTGVVLCAALHDTASAQSAPKDSAIRTLPTRAPVGAPAAARAAQAGTDPATTVPTTAVHVTPPTSLRTGTTGDTAQVKASALPVVRPTALSDSAASVRTLGAPTKVTAPTTPKTEPPSPRKP